MDDQLPLLGPRGGLRPKLPAAPGVARAWVQVVTDAQPAQLDRPFDYAVPERWHEQAQVGVRVRVILGGQKRNGFVIARFAETPGASLRPIESVVGDLPVLTPDVAKLCRAVADHYGATMAQLLRQAVPARHATTERTHLARETPAVERPAPGQVQVPPSWATQDPAIRQLFTQAGHRMALSPSAGHDPRQALGELVVAASGHGLRPLVIVPDFRDVEVLGRAIKTAGPHLRVAVGQAQSGPTARYAEFLTALAGHCDVVLGTRNAVFSPFAADLLLLWHDTDDSLRDQRAPYWHARDVLAMRSHASGARLAIVSPFHSLQTHLWVQQRWLASGPAVRNGVPRAIGPHGADAHSGGRFPSSAMSAIREGLAAGPVLISVGRLGYLPLVVCANCRAPALCPVCGDVLTLASGADGQQLRCLSCDHAREWECSECGGVQFRAGAVGIRRTEEELGKAFPGVKIIISTQEHYTPEVDGKPSLVLATQGVEPETPDGYAAVVLPDARADLSRPGFTTYEDTAGEWFRLASLAQAAAPIIVNAPIENVVVRGLVTQQPGKLAAHLLAERRDLSLPPVVVSAELTGELGQLVQIEEEATKNGFTAWLSAEDFESGELDTDLDSTAPTATLRVVAQQRQPLLDFVQRFRSDPAVKTIAVS